MLATYCGLPLTLVRPHYMTCDGETWVTGVSHGHGVPQNRTPTYAFSDLLKTTSGAHHRNWQSHSSHLKLPHVFKFNLHS